ncbi:MAG: DUF1788 domain-containing protein [Desulfovibrionaceae bacterium]|nr:DUF1788 domain-containing protein [Desulfovibrionaceae bacterium]
MNFIERLNMVHERLVSPELLSNAGLGNEIGFYIFDYPPEQELVMRQWLKDLPGILRHKAPDLKFMLQDVFALILEYMKSEEIYEDVIAMQKEEGNDAVASALSDTLDPVRLAAFFREHVRPEEYDLVILHSIGSSWPLMRSHTLLNNLQPIMGKVPLVMFYPGIYDMQGLSLFGKLHADNYYRAFQLVS